MCVAGCVSQTIFVYLCVCVCMRGMHGGLACLSSPLAVIRRDIGSMTSQKPPPPPTAGAPLSLFTLSCVFGRRSQNLCGMLGVKTIILAHITVPLFFYHFLFLVNDGKKRGDTDDGDKLYRINFFFYRVCMIFLTAELLSESESAA